MDFAVDGMLQPERGLNAGQQFALVYWLSQEIIRPGFDALDAIVEAIEGRHHDDRDQPRLVIPFHDATNCEAIHDRHHDV
jgi:hypothetical protein